MKTMNLLKWAAIVCIAVAFTACSDDNDEVKKPLDVKEVKEMKSNDFGTWQYFSFEKGEVVGTGSTDPRIGDDAKWKERTDWDIAFNRYNVRTNSGISGNGKGGIVKIEGTDLMALKEAPTEGYVVDSEVKTYISMPPKGPQDTPMVGMNTAVKGWVVINMSSPGVYTDKITPTLCVLKTANGKYVKLFLKNYKNAKGQNGYLTFQYVYQNDGTNLFK